MADLKRERLLREAYDAAREVEERAYELQQAWARFQNAVGPLGDTALMAHGDRLRVVAFADAVALIRDKDDRPMAGELKAGNGLLWLASSAFAVTPKS